MKKSMKILLWKARTGVTVICSRNARFDIDTGGADTGLDFFVTTPTSGPLKDVVLYQQPSAAGNLNRMNGSLEFSEIFSGIIYLPDQDFDLRGALAFKTLLKTGFAARDVMIRGSLQVTIPDTSATTRLTANNGTPILIR